MYISLFSALSFLVCGSVARSSVVQVQSPENLGGINLVGCGPKVDLIAELDLIATSASIKGVNFFRIPVTWQTLVKNNPASISFDSRVFARYDRLVQAALGTGASVMIDLRDNGKWKSTPSDQDFANIYYNIGEYYASDAVIFGILDKPHNRDMLSWSVTLQGAVNAIRAAGASSQPIALAGDLSLGEAWVNGKNSPLLRVVDPAARSRSDKSKLIIDIHHQVNSRECSISHIQHLASWLDINKRQAIVSEIGGDGIGSCLGEYLSFINKDKNFVGFAVDVQSLRPKDLRIQRHQDELFKRFVQPNLLAPTNPTPIRTPKTRTRNRRQDAPSATPAPDINRQTYTGDLGAEAPPVYDYNAQFIVDGQVFPRLLDAVGLSCYKQRVACLEAAAKWGYVAPLSAENCNTEQFQACLTAAVVEHEAIGHSGPFNEQKFVAAAGGALPSSVYPVLDLWVTNGVPFADRVMAMQTSCQTQHAACLGVASSELCQTQLDACMYAADGSTSVIPAGYKITGCMAELANQERALQGAVLLADDMTQGKCLEFCSSQGFPLAGMEFGRECYCDSVIRRTASNTTLLPESECALPCAYNPNEMCGGRIALTLYNNVDMYPILRLPDGWTENGCLTDTRDARTFSGYSFASNAMTPQVCTTECQNRGYRFAGVEYSSECWCSNAINPVATTRSESECSMLCSGDVTRFCGGPDRLSTWSFDPNFTSVAERKRTLRFDRFSI